LAKNIGTSVEMIERFYGQTKTKEQAIAMTKGFQEQKRPKKPRPAHTRLRRRSHFGDEMGIVGSLLEKLCFITSRIWGDL